MLSRHISSTPLQSRLIDACVVPYAASDEWFQVHNAPERGRILFIGTAGLRKGIHTLGLAASLPCMGKYTFVVAGDVTEAVRSHFITRNLQFLGRLTKPQLSAELSRADVFALPSLAEGSAEASYQALAAGVPNVVTLEVGSVVRDGMDGFIVPANNPEELANRIDQIVADRDLRRRMSQAARMRAMEYTWERYGERLLDALNSI